MPGCAVKRGAAKLLLPAFALRPARLISLGSVLRACGLPLDALQCLSGGADGRHSATVFRCLPGRFCLAVDCSLMADIRPKSLRVEPVCSPSPARLPGWQIESLL